jgi:hypothetical protein
MERGTRHSPVIPRAQQLAESGIRCWHGAMTEYSQAYQRLRHYIAERMRTSHLPTPDADGTAWEQQSGPSVAPLHQLRRPKHCWHPPRWATYP